MLLIRSKKSIFRSFLTGRSPMSGWSRRKILAAMNLPDRAVELLAGRINTVEDARIRSEMALQLARSQKVLE